MPFDSELDAGRLERLSALVDGELERDAIAQACADWRERNDTRATWHAYHVIGDVLRSDDLAADPVADLAFLRALRQRMQDEPVVLAPQSLSTASQPAPAPAAVHALAASRRRTWVASSAVAAGFVAVAGVLVFTRTPTAPSDAPAVARVEQRTPTVQAAVEMSPMPGQPVPPASEPPALVANGQFIRDARLDGYLAAHKQFAGSSALGVPSGFLRNATAAPSER